MSILMRWMLVLFLGGGSLLWASEEQIALDHAPIERSDRAALQRGFAMYSHYCQGCHSLEHARYNQVAKDLGMTREDGSVAEDLLKTYLIPTGVRPNDPILSAMPQKLSKEWFGVTPPDLTLAARVHGPDWLYSYLRGFYQDDTKPWGVNNRVFPDVAMPNVLGNLQGTREAIYKEHLPGHPKSIEMLRTLQPGTMSEAQFDQVVLDLVTFLDYIAEPQRQAREQMGWKVLLFLVLFTFAAYKLKKEYWKDIS